MHDLFAATSIRGMQLDNRFIRSATWEGLAADDGGSTARLTETMVQLADGGVGLIITGHAFVSAEGRAGPWQLGVHGDDLLPGLTDMTDAVHRAGGAIALQLAHAGAYGATALSGREAVGPSPIPNATGTACRSLEPAEIRRIVEEFTAAAGRARRAGFDAVQIHAAHGYLLSQFLSPHYNRRTDGYGGSIENRARFLTEVVASVREAVGAEFPVLVKLNSDDFIDGGLTLTDAMEAAALAEQAEADAVELSGGTIRGPSEFNSVRPGKVSRGQEGYYREAGRLCKRRVGVPVILVGGIRSVDTAEELVREGAADYIALCRPLICEPNLVRRWQSGDRGPSRCGSDNACFGPALAGEGVYCVVERKRETTR